MKKLVLTIIVSLFTQNLMAYQILNLAEYRDFLDQKIKQLSSDCESQAVQIKQGAIYNALKEQHNLDDQSARLCNKDYSKLLKRFCQKKIEALNLMKNYTSNDKLSEISKGFSGRPESTAVGAVILFKTKKDLQFVHGKLVESIDQYVKKSKCEPLHEDRNLKHYLNQYFDEQYDLVNQTTLRAE